MLILSRILVRHLGDGSPHSFDVLTSLIKYIKKPHDSFRRCQHLLRVGGVLLLKTLNAEGLLKQGPWWLRPYLALYRQLV